MNLLENPGEIPEINHCSILDGSSGELTEDISRGVPEGALGI